MKRIILFTIFIVFITAPVESAILSPDEFLGFSLGADRKLADYHQITAYFQLLNSASPRLTVINLGKTTLNNDLILVVISSEKNLENLEKYININKRLAQPADLKMEEVEVLLNQGRVTALITSNIHSTEIGSSQMVMELAYQLITRSDPEVTFYLDHVILLFLPSANPDGQLMVVDWYRQWIGTVHEGSRMPWLYHHYTGHDANRDFFMLTQKESKLINQVISHNWCPQVHLDEHQMGSSGPRMFVPPYKDPVSPNLHPLLMRMEAVFGSNMSFRLEENGMSGVIDSWLFDSYWPGGSRTSAWKNIISLLTELASCRIATPIFIDEIELSAGDRGLAEYKQQVNFPRPWPGGWWRLRDIIDYELVATFSFLETSAKYRYDILKSYYTMNLDAIHKGEQEPPFAYIIPLEQHDPITTAKLIDILLQHRIEIYLLENDLIIGGRIYPQGSFIIPMAQPLRQFIKEILDIQHYPEIKSTPEGEIHYPYDVTAWCLPLQMGVRCEKIDSPQEIPMTKLRQAPYPIGKLDGKSRYGYAISHQLNHTSIAINRLLNEGVPVYIAPDGMDPQIKAGTVIIPQRTGVEMMLLALARALHLTIQALPQPLPERLWKIKQVRLGLYKPWQVSMDEGWTRWLLEQHEFPLVSVDNETIKKGKLNQKFDVLLIPDIDKQTIIDPRPKETREAKFYRPLPEKYEGGIGIDGVKNLKEFVQQGGTLITLDSGCMLPIDEFPLPVTNVLEKISQKEFNAPGVLLKIAIDTAHPIGWGMPETAAAFFSQSPAFKTATPFGEVDRKIIARYPEEPLLLSGWINGEKLLHKKAAIVELTLGKGKIILLGFRIQHRAQPHATFKLLFNAIHYGKMDKN